MTGSGGSSACASFALFGGGATDVFDEKRADAALRIVSGNARFAAIDDEPDAIDCYRGLRHIRRDDYFAERIGNESEVLIFGRQIAVQWNEGKALLGAAGANGADG